MKHALVDNDVLIKLSAYGLLVRLLSSQPYGASNFAFLGTAKYVVPKRLTKQLTAQALDAALQEFEAAKALMSFLEPTNAEIAFAAELEQKAQTNNLELDAGESLLCSILIIRSLDLLFTGDKRAIAAIGGLIAIGVLGGLNGKIVCLEQLILWLLKLSAQPTVEAAVCALPAVDKSLSFCFSCTTGHASSASILEGLHSNIADLRHKAPSVLVN